MERVLESKKLQSFNSKDLMIQIFENFQFIVIKKKSNYLKTKE